MEKQFSSIAYRPYPSLQPDRDARRSRGRSDSASSGDVTVPSTPTQQGTSQRATTTRQQTVTYMFLPVEVVPYHTYLVPDSTIPYHIIPDLS